MKAMGHSSVLVSQKYVHPTPKAMERAFERLDAANEKAIAGLQGGQETLMPTAVSATADEAESEVISLVL